MEIVPDPIPQQILTSVRNALASATVQGVPIFVGPIGLVDDVESFVNVADVLAGPAPDKAQAGVVSADVDNRPGTTSSENRLYRLPIDVVIRFALMRGPMQDEAAAVVRAKYFGDVVRQCLLADPSRGGKCGLVQWDGRIINGTDTSGSVRMIGGPPNQTFYTVIVPAECAWYD